MIFLLSTHGFKGFRGWNLSDQSELSQDDLSALFISDRQIKRFQLVI
jgi:hypothetical protein